jgi:hypothetical protein
VKRRTDYLTQVSESRAKIAALQQEHEQVRTAPRPLVEAVARIDRGLDLEAARLRAPLGALVSPDAPLPMRMQLDDVGDVSPLIASLFRQQVRELLVAAVTRHYKEHPPGLPALERAAKLRELDAEILRLEHEEEATIREAEGAGLELDRRADASPAAVLHVEHPATQAPRPAA